MKKSFKWNAASTLFFAVAFASPGTAGSQEPFPDEPGRDTLFFVCTQCHALNRITDADATAEDWEFILYDMISRGAPVYKNDIDKLQKYLIDNFAINAQ